MTKLALAIGFLAVFGFVAYSFVLILTKHFGKNSEEKSNQNNNPQNNKQNEAK